MSSLFGPEPVFDAKQALAAVSNTHWTIEHQECAKAAVDAVLNQELGPSDDEGTLTLYDLVPEVWCAPDRSAAALLIAENIAFAVLDAWTRAVRSEIQVTSATPPGETALREALTKVRACRKLPGKVQSIHGQYEIGASWSISELTKLLPEIDAALNPDTSKR